MTALLEDMKGILIDTGMSQRKLDKKVEQYSNEYMGIAGQRNEEVLSIDNMLLSITDWQYQVNRAYQNGNTITWKRDLESDDRILSFKTNKIENYQKLKFNCILDYTDPDHWMGFTLRNSDYQAYFSHTQNYLVILKPFEKIAELQRYGTKFFIETYPLEDVEYGKEFQVEYGAVDTPEGNVHITFKVNGKTVIDYLDTDPQYKIKDAGYFAVYMPDANRGNTVTILPARDIAKETEEQ